MRGLWVAGLAVLLVPVAMAAGVVDQRVTLSLNAEDVIPTGNEWMALPEIRAVDGAIGSFNVISMRNRGLLQVNGAHGQPALAPYFMADGKPLAFHAPAWELIEYWIPTAHETVDGLDATITYCAPPGARGVFVHMTLTNRRTAAVPVALGMKASWGSLDRVTYVPVEMSGTRTVGAAPWVGSGEAFSYVTNDTQFAWTVVHPGSVASVTSPPESEAPAVNAQHTAMLAPGESAAADFVVGAGVEEFSAAHHASVLGQRIAREGADSLIAQEAAWCRERTKTTGQADLDVLMNRNFLFTEMYAWGRTIDTEQMVGVTSRSPRYYVSAAYWDRDAMLWSFPALLDIDHAKAREALEYALTTQLRNTGTHSRFVDGIVLEDGFQLDEAVAPVIALAEYVKATGDDGFLRAHRDALVALRDKLLARYDAGTGLYSSLQDSQDEFQKLPFLTYDNVLSWRALVDMAGLFERLNSAGEAKEIRDRAAALHQAILQRCVASGAPGADGPIFVSATDGKQFVFTDIPPGSLMKLPALGFVAETDPVFARTYAWLHSGNYAYSYFDKPYGLPGSYRLPFTTSWTIADHLLLHAGKAQALKILRASEWDGGIITEGVDPTTGRMDLQGRAFATAAGYVAHTICAVECVNATPAAGK